MRSVAIVTHIKKEAPYRIVPELITWLQERGIEVKLPLEEARELSQEGLGRDEKGLLQGTDLIIILGGDGTVLRVARMLQKNIIPIFGVNLGRVGFLMRFEEVNLYQALGKVLSGDYGIERRAMIQTSIDFQDGSHMERLSLNEVLISGEEFNRLIVLDVDINGSLFSRFALDGLIVATPTGTTAYSLSAGGPLVSPKADLLLLTPICPHSLFNRTMVLAPTDNVTITPATREKIDKIRISLDGVAVGAAISNVKISMAAEKFKFVTLNGPDYFANIRRKLHDLDYFTKD